jgi:hypothetical protein
MIGNSQHRGEIFLSRPEWIERPWKLVSKTPLDELTDLLFEYQVILQQVNDLPQGASQIVLCHIFRDAIAKSLKVESAMRAVYKNFEQSVSGMLYWPDFSTLESPLDDDTQLGKLFPISFHFPVFFVAQVVTMYWSGMVAVHFLLMYTYAKIPALESIETSPSTLEDPLRPTSAGMRSFEHSKEWLSMGRNICQSVEYFLQDKLGVAGLVGILAHLRGYKSCLDNFGDERSREIAWIAERIERIQKKFDFPVNDIFGD